MQNFFFLWTWAKNNRKTKKNKENTKKEQWTTSPPYLSQPDKPVNDQERSLQINVKEMLALFYSLRNLLDKVYDADQPLRFFAPIPCHLSLGTNVFPTIVVPDLCPRKYWCPILCQKCIASTRLGRKGGKSILLSPSKSLSCAWEARPLQWDLWMFRFNLTLSNSV